MAETTADNIFSYALKEKNYYETGVGIPVAENWYWKMYEHCNYTLLMKNGQFPLTQTKMGERPQKNIMLPILNVAYRTEGFDVKDIEAYVDDPDYFHLSFLARKYHDKWARENSIDTFIDEVVEALDYGFVIVKNENNKRPVVVQPQQIAFVDQTDILSGPIALKHQYSVDQLLDMQKQGWDATNIDTAIRYAKSEKVNSQSQGMTSKTPSKYVEVFEIHGTFCDDWLTKDGDETYNGALDPNSYSKQVHIITYTKDEKDQKIGLTLYKGKAPTKDVFKVMVINPIFGRAAGRGRVEALFESQIWTNFNMIHMTNMLREASKVIHITTDKKFTQQNNTKNLQGGEFLVAEPNTTTGQLNTQPVNFNLFDKANAEWEQHARTTGSASDPALGIDPVSGTPLGTTQIVTNQGEGIHEYIRGKVAVFMNEIYQDWVIDYLVADMLKGDKWSDELSMDELQKVAEDIATNESNNRIKKIILSGGTVTPEQQKTMMDLLKSSFMKGGNKKFIEIVKGEFKEMPLKVKFNIANKQKDLSKMVDKLSNIWRSIFANPQGFAQTMQIPGAAKAFNEMLEASGLSPIDFDFTKMPVQQAPQPQPQGQPSPVQLPQQNSQPVPQGQ